MKTICKLLPILFSLCFTSCTSDVDTNKIESSTLYNNDSLSAVTELNDDSCLHFDLSSVPDITIDLEPDEQEKEEVREIVENAIVALQTQDFKGMAKYIDFEVWYYAAHGESADENTLANELEKNYKSNNGLTMWAVSPLSKFEYGDVEIVDPNTVFLNEIEQSVFFSPAVYLMNPVEKAYVVHVTDVSNEEKVDGELYAVKINGTWKADYAYIMDKNYHDEVLKIALEEQSKGEKDE